MIRKAVVAGQFYPGNKASLTREVEECTRPKKQKIEAIGVVSPHAGYIYSGPVAGEVLSSLKPRQTYVILGPNHTGLGKPFGMDLEDAWATPLGEVEVDKELGEAILKRSGYIKKDSACHAAEHSIEVQLPFLQYLNKAFKFVPIVIAPGQRVTYKKIGLELATAIKDLKKDVTIIASSDMTHYEPHEAAKKKDQMAIEKILALDIDGFLDIVEEWNISMCGFAPTAIMMQAAITLGANVAKLIKYNTSGDTSGDFSTVVGYAGIALYKE
ncbi:AmmeMemoRadiSam system protein B [Candidatus Omnitrophota bacterium]